MALKKKAFSTINVMTLLSVNSRQAPVREFERKDPIIGLELY